MRLPNTIETVTGLSFDYTAPEIRLADVAHGLSNVCRFAGHTDHYYSVAEHSVLVSNLVEGFGLGPEMALAGLWHDAHEAYMGDIATPLKELVGDAYRSIAARIDIAVCAFIGFNTDEPPFRHPMLKFADEVAMLYEASELKLGPGWEFTRRLDHSQAARAAQRRLGLTPSSAAALFRTRHHDLMIDIT